MAENQFVIKIEADNAETLKELIDFHELLKESDDEGVLQWFEARSPQAAQMLVSVCCDDEAKQKLVEGLQKEMPGFNFAWEFCSSFRWRKDSKCYSRYWYPDWCESLKDVIYPDAGFIIERVVSYYRVQYRFMHDTQAPITAIFLARLFIAAKLDVTDFDVNLE